MSKTREELIEVEVERLRGESLTLARDWRRIPWLVSTIVLAVPTHLVWGPTAAVYAVLCVPCLIGTAAYLVGVRRRTNRREILDLTEQLATMDASRLR